MKIELANTTCADISAALVNARRRTGAAAMGMVLTLVVVAEEHTHEDALRCAAETAREHPSRVIGVILGRVGSRARMDAVIQVGGESGPGESLLLRLHGELARHPDSVVVPLLLPESPVVVWWPGRAPDSPATDPLGSLAQRRITDAAAVARPFEALFTRCDHYTPGDTDLAWTRLTAWRALLAAALDQHPAPVSAILVQAERKSASADLLAAWLAARLHAPAEVRANGGPGITAVQLTVPDGMIEITRPDGVLAAYSVPGQPARHVALRRREIPELLAEELRRLDPDDVYAQVVRELVVRHRPLAGARTRGRAVGRGTATVRRSTTARSGTARHAAGREKRPGRRTDRTGRG